MKQNIDRHYVSSTHRNTIPSVTQVWTQLNLEFKTIAVNYIRTVEYVFIHRSSHAAYFVSPQRLISWCHVGNEEKFQFGSPAGRRIWAQLPQKPVKRHILSLILSLCIPGCDYLLFALLLYETSVQLFLSQLEEKRTCFFFSFLFIFNVSC